MSSITSRQRELLHAEVALLLAVILQLTLNQRLLVGSKYLLSGLELLLMAGIGITAPIDHYIGRHLRRVFSLVLIGVITAVNATSLLLVAGALIHGSVIPGVQLLVAALAIFATNIIIFSLWYWEIDSPGLTGLHRHDDNPKFQFPQMTDDSNKWEPSYFDYLYLSTTNATAFSPTDTLPFSHGAKALMGIQALISLLTLALVAARAVSILG